MRAFPLIAALTALLIMPAVAHAFAYLGQTGTSQVSPLPLQTPGSVLPVVWPDSRVDVPFTLNFDSSYTASALEAMEQGWNSVGTRLQFLEGTASAQPCNTRDGINVAGWRTVFCDGSNFGDALAISMVSFVFNSATDQWEITDVDIIVDENRQWVPNFTGTPPTGTLDFRRVLTHELGHALGLEHPDEAGQAVVAIMNSTVSDIETLQDDDIQGLNFLYGGSGGGNSNNGGANDNGSDEGGSGGDVALLFLAAVLLYRRYR